MAHPFKSEFYEVFIVTPTHIGTNREKALLQGQDYFYENGYYYLIDKKMFYRCLSPSELHRYSQALVNNNIKDAEGTIVQAANVKESIIIQSVYCPFRHPEIRKHISDGLGKLICPGSTLKGSVRSILGNYLMQKTGLSSFEEIKLFGQIDKNLMRYLQVGDVSFDQTTGDFTPMKIYSGDSINNKKRGQWKDARQGCHSSEFREKGFTTLWETVIEGSKSRLRLNWADPVFNLSASRISNTQYFGEFIQNWMDIARVQMEKYLDQEIKFFETYQNDDSEDVIPGLESLKQINSKNDCIIMRVGSGIGFHAITGNWKYADHTNPEIDYRTNQIKYKTRKVAFYENDGQQRKVLPGFIKIKRN